MPDMRFISIRARRYRRGCLRSRWPIASPLRIFSAFDVVNCHGDNYLLRSKRPVVRTFHGTASDEFRNAKTLGRRLFFLLQIPLEHLGAALADHVVGISESDSGADAGGSVDYSVRRRFGDVPFGAENRSTDCIVRWNGEVAEKALCVALLMELFKSEVLPEIPAAELRMVSERQSLEPGVRRYGRVSSETLAELYRSAWAFCLPSTYEGFGVPYIEAMAARTAVIATSPNPGAREVLSDGSYGCLRRRRQARGRVEAHSLRFRGPGRLRATRRGAEPALWLANHRRQLRKQRFSPPQKRRLEHERERLADTRAPGARSDLGRNASLPRERLRRTRPRPAERLGVSAAPR